MHPPDLGGQDDQAELDAGHVVSWDFALVGLSL